MNSDTVYPLETPCSCGAGVADLRKLLDVYAKMFLPTPRVHSVLDRQVPWLPRTVGLSIDVSINVHRLIVFPPNKRGRMS